MLKSYQIAYSGYLLLLLSCLSCLVKAETVYYDSLLNQVKAATTENELIAIYYSNASVPNLTHPGRLLFLKKGIEKSRSLGFDQAEANFIYGLSVVHTIQGGFEKAIELALISYDIYKNHDDFYGMANCYNTLGGMTAFLGDHEKGKDYLRQAIELNEKAGVDTALRVNNYLVLGNCYKWSGDYREAEVLYKQALQAAIETNSVKETAFAYNNLASLSIDTKNFNQSKAYYEKALGVSREEGIPDVEALILRKLGNISYIEKDYDQAEKYYHKSLMIAEKHHFQQYIMDVYNALTELYQKKNDFKNAFNSLQKYVVVKDSFQTVEKAREFEWLRIEFETEKKEEKIKDLELESKTKDLQARSAQNTRNLFIFWSVLVLGILLFLFNRFRLKQKTKLLSLELASQKEKNESEKELIHLNLKALKAQMNPHFIFNALNSIQEFILLNDKLQVNTFLGKFADLMRKTLDMSNQEKIVLSDEIHTLRLYLELEAIRFEDTFQYHIHIAENIATDSIRIPPMLIQPYIENAIKHGLLHKKTDRKLEISFFLPSETNLLYCEVTDNGVGREQSAEINARRKHTHKSFATNATEKRLKLINHGLTNAIGVEITDLYDHREKSAGTKVLISIPIEVNKKKM